MDHLRGKLHQTFRKAHERHARITAEPVTRNELEARKKLREQPAHGLHLEPGGFTRRTGDPTRHAENERRMQVLRQRLGRMKGRARDDFERGR